MGVIIIGLGFMGLHKADSILERTQKGRRLVQLVGATNAPLVWRGLMVSIIIFGLLLACGIIRPIQW